MIYKNVGVYHLTLVGMIVAKKILTVDKLSKLIDDNERFFNEHDLAWIPENLQYRIDELGTCRLIENRMDNITATYTEVMDKISRSNKVFIISPIFDPYYPKFLLSMTQQKIPVFLIVTESILKMLKAEYANEIKTYLEYDNAKLFVIEDARFAFAVTDTFVSMSLYHKNGYFDPMTNLMSFEKSALKWGEELFDQYLKRSTEIKCP